MWSTVLVQSFVDNMDRGIDQLGGKKFLIIKKPAKEQNQFVKGLIVMLRLN